MWCSIYHEIIQLFQTAWEKIHVYMKSYAFHNEMNNVYEINSSKYYYLWLGCCSNTKKFVKIIFFVLSSNTQTSLDYTFLVLRWISNNMIPIVQNLQRLKYRSNNWLHLIKFTIYRYIYITFSKFFHNLKLQLL